MKKLKNEMRWKMNKSMKWGWFKVPVKVEKINEYLFSDTVQSKKKSGSDEISQGQGHLHSDTLHELSLFIAAVCVYEVFIVAMNLRDYVLYFAFGSKCNLIVIDYFCFGSNYNWLLVFQKVIVIDYKYGV